jgi:hypothetical protein
MFRRGVAIGLLSLLAMLGVSPWIACGGWQATAEARHACCTSRLETCPNADDPDSCCAQKESRSQSDQTARVQVDSMVATAPAPFVAQFTAQLNANARTLALPTGTLDAHDQSSLYLQHSLLRV